ncbi:uncharacterized protein IUM83_16046 [Phytophthora cinnamomi]|uniref:uncharacterized protein n=1 Tax=Phytophthora cinnamomi TaxID=4785 RepID=UPI00355A4E1A|nr:hypothetical protein IUM83_16046 [Phytophthora cinnamomi]
MARSKEQWKAQQRAQHTQTKSNAFFQMKRPGVAHPTGARPQALPATSAVFQLGRPTSAAAAAAVRPAVMKPDPGQTPGLLRTSASGQTACIDLTLDDEDEEEDEPMGTQLQPPAARTPAATAAATAPAAPAIATATAIPAPPPAAATISAASDGVKLRMLDGGSAPIVMALPLERSESASELMVPLAEDVESDVDEEWPSVPLSVNEQSPAGQKEEEVKAALDAIRKTIPLSEERQGQNVAQRIAPTKSIAQTGALPLNANDDDEMEVDVDEELPSRATEGGDSPTTVNRIVRVENLEDGEIFEEGAAPKPAIEVQRAVMLEQETDAHPVDAMEIRPHLRNKKQKKRGKKKTKRKLEAMQMMDAPAGCFHVDSHWRFKQSYFVQKPNNQESSFRESINSRER